MWRMNDDALLRELEEYCRLAGLKASTVCVRALNDSRFVSRHRRRLDRIAQDSLLLRQFMTENPPGRGGEGIGAAE